MLDTIPAIFLDATDRGGHHIAFSVQRGGAWVPTTWYRAMLQVASIAELLHGWGVGPGVKVGILAGTCPEWAAVDMASLCLRGVTVGVYPSLLAEPVRYILDHAAVEVLVVQDAAQADKIASVRSALPALREVVSIDAVPGLPQLDALLGPPNQAWLRARAAEVQPDDLATLIYTSGTTGDPKGVELSHGNFARICHAADVPELEPGDRSLIWLPLAHSLQRMASYRGLLSDRGRGWYVGSVDALPDTLAVARPTVLASVPRMLEKVRDRAETVTSSRGPRVRAVYDWAFRQGRRRTELLQAGRRVPRRLRARIWLAERLVFGKIKQRLGGELRVIISGGAALNPEVCHWFYALGIPVLEGWGLTETSAPATCNREQDFRVGSVGKPLNGVEVRRAEDGELLVRGVGVFRGYYRDDDATREAFTEDGWFCTGDIGEIDADGFVWITDRKKEILITAGGKNVPPVNLEQRVERSPYVATAVAVGNGRPYLVALLFPDLDALAALGLPQAPLADQLARPEVAAHFAAAVEAANAELASFESIKRWAVLPHVLSVAGGELTPTLKLKRRVIDAHFADAIEALYA